DRGAGRPDAGQLHRFQRQGAAHRRRARGGPALSLRQSQAQQDEPAHLPQAHGRAKRQHRRGIDGRTLRLSPARAGAAVSGRAIFLEGPERAGVAAIARAPRFCAAVCASGEPAGCRHPGALIVATTLASSGEGATFSGLRIPYSFARTHGVLPIAHEGDAVVVLMRPDATLSGIAELKRVLQRPLATRAVDHERFAAELARAYNVAAAGVPTIAADLARDDLARLMQDLPEADDLLDSDAQAPVVRMINALLLQALRERASDVHFEPYEARSVVRFRIDGVLRDVIEPPRALHGALVSRVKIMASLDIAEKRLPQDGRIALK